YRVNDDLRRLGVPGERPLTNLVYMGMGEPLHNYDNVMRSLELLLSKEGANFSHRHITVSTSGLVPNIVRFGEDTQVKLAVSLNATTDEQRARLMPVDKKWDIAALMDAVRKFPSRQGRRVTFEYHGRHAGKGRLHAPERANQRHFGRAMSIPPWPFIALFKIGHCRRRAELRDAAGTGEAGN
ncbi:MAG: radical SAM protein, partial [Deltaproteobacteria bacterium]